MLGILLITWKNGRIVKTYGLNRLKNYNMKFTFICSVILISCSVCASGDLEIYPGLKFDLASEQHRRRLDNNEEPLYVGNYQKWPWSQFQEEDEEESPNRDQPFDLELPVKIRQFADLFNRNQKTKEDPLFNYPRGSFDDTYDEYRNLEKERKFQRYDFSYPSSQILDDVRLYPQDDFSFGDENNEEEEMNEDTSKSMHHGRDANEHVMGIVHETEEKEASGRGALEEAKLADDPSQFAYLPSDIRFFQNIETTESVKEDQATQSKFEKLKDNKIHLNHRSDESFSGNPQQAAFDDNRAFNKDIDGVVVKPQLAPSQSAGVYIIAVVAGISAAATVGLIAVGIGWYNLQKHVKNASDVEYPAYGVTGPNKDASPSGDRRLAQSAQMYHYQHQKQQIIAMESRAAAGDRHGSVSEADSEEENEEGDYTVYECPGLAPTGEMEVKNPLFQDDTTPAQTPPVKPDGEKK